MIQEQDQWEESIENFDISFLELTVKYDDLMSTREPAMGGVARFSEDFFPGPWLNSGSSRRSQAEAERV